MAQYIVKEMINALREYFRPVTQAWSYIFLFKEGRNRYERICKRCGAHQNQYSYYSEDDSIAMPRFSWWEEVYPLGNDPNCICHKRATYRL